MGLMSQPSPADINPYASPSAASSIGLVEQPERPRFSFLAVIVGWLVDVVSTMVAGLLFGMVLGVFLVVQGTPVQRIQQVLSDSTAFVLASLLIGTCGSILGGYVAAWIARQRELRHALATGIASLTYGFAMLLLQSLSPIPLFQPQPLWISIIAFALTVPAATCGGWLRRTVASHNRR